MPWLPSLRLGMIAALEERINVTLESAQAEPVCPLCGQVSSEGTVGISASCLTCRGQACACNCTCACAGCSVGMCAASESFTPNVCRSWHSHMREERSDRQKSSANWLCTKVGKQRLASRIAKAWLRPARPSSVLCVTCRCPHLKHLAVLGSTTGQCVKGRRMGLFSSTLSAIDLLTCYPTVHRPHWSSGCVNTHGIEIISRDRANDYADGAARGAPDAIQVADRFHLLKNIREMLERLLERNHTSLRSAAHEVSRRLAMPLSPPAASSESTSATQLSQNATVGSVAQAQPLAQSELRRQQHRANRFACYTEVRRLQAEGMGIRAIARQLKLSRETVRRFASDEFPERARRAPGRGKLDPYIPYLAEQLTA